MGGTHAAPPAHCAAQAAAKPPAAPPGAATASPAAPVPAPAPAPKGTIASALLAAGLTDCLAIIDATPGAAERVRDPATAVTVFCPTNEVRPTQAAPRGP
jgi:hypothetical protein